MLRLFLLLLIVSLTAVFGWEDKNILIYGGGNIEVNAEINTYETLAAGKPILGTIMITHDSSSRIDESSFRLGNHPLTVKFLQAVAMSSYSSLVVSTYSFQLAGMQKGAHTLPPINVNVGGTTYQAPALTIDIPD